MTDLTAAARRRARMRAIIALAVVAAGFALLTTVDRPLTVALFTPRYRVDPPGWLQLLRALGYAPTWLLIAGCVALCDHAAHRTPVLSRAGLIAGAPLLAGGLAELGKLIVGRARPIEGEVLREGAAYVFRPFLSGFVDGGNLGLPSSHAAVAFGGAVMFGCLFRPTRWLLIAVAIGCGITRVLTGAHYPTDAFAGGVIGWLVAIVMHRWAVSFDTRPVPTDITAG